MADLLNKKVRHKTEGEGIVVSVTEKGDIKDLDIDFNGKIKRYRYPHEALVFCDINVQKQAIDDLEKYKSNQQKASAQKIANVISQINTQAIKSHNNLNVSISKINNRILEYGKYYGTTAKEIYSQCCDVFNWEKKEIGKFGQQQELYAMDATPEKFSVWFLAHSNWTATKNGKWHNSIDTSKGIIEEYWDDKSIARFDKDKEPRVVFAKDKTNKYLFLGVYENESIDEKNSVKAYRKISNVYPIINGEND